MDYTFGELVLETIISHTGAYCTMMYILYNCYYAKLFSIILPISRLGYATLESPRAPPAYWKFCLWYILGVIMIKFLFQLPLFCWNLSSTTLYPSIQPLCPVSSSGGSDSEIEGDTISAVMQALRSNNQFLPLLWFDKTPKESLLKDCIVDVAALLVTIAHIFHLQKRGLWTQEGRDAGAGAFQHDDSSSLGGESLLNRGHDLLERLAPSSISKGLQHMLPTISQDTLYHDAKLVNLLAENIGPSAAQKIGTDTYAIMFNLQILMLLSTILGFGTISSVENFAEELSNNQFNGQMVAMAAFIVFIILADRVAYIRRALRLKLLLQAFVLVCMHGIIFFYIPATAGIRFQEKAFLVWFYILLCAYPLYHPDRLSLAMKFSLGRTF